MRRARPWWIAYAWRHPSAPPPETFLDTLAELVAQLPPYDRISVGFPGVVRNGTVLVAAAEPRE